LSYNKVTFEQGKSTDRNSFLIKYIENSFFWKFGLNVNKGLSSKERKKVTKEREKDYVSSILVLVIVGPGAGLTARRGH
jgi:hypothetical protein